jgi:hypothetical protein
MHSTGEQAIGSDITGTSDAIVMASAPDVALPKETESAADSGILDEQTDISGGPRQQTPLAAIGAAAAAGLVVGFLLKKSLPSVKGRC